jgi:hypothetical protein
MLDIGFWKIVSRCDAAIRCAAARNIFYGLCGEMMV